MLPPLDRVEREDRADRRVGDRSYMSVPRVGPGPGDHGGQPDGLLGVPQGGDHHAPEPLEAVQDGLRVVRPQVERRAGNGQSRDHQRLPGGVQPLDKRHDAVVPAGDRGEHAHVEDVRRWGGSAVLAHRYLCDAGSCAAWASTWASMRATWSGSARSAASRHSLRAFWSRCRSASSASLTTADTDGALPASTRRSAYAARCGSMVTVTRIFRSLIPGSCDWDGRRPEDTPRPGRASARLGRPPVSRAISIVPSWRPACGIAQKPTRGGIRCRQSDGSGRYPAWAMRSNQTHASKKDDLGPGALRAEGDQGPGRRAGEEVTAWLR